MSKHKSKVKAPEAKVEAPKVEVKSLSATTLGRLLATYARLESALKSQGIDADSIAQRIHNRKSDDSITYDVPLDALESQLATIKVKTSEAKLDGRKVAIANIQRLAMVSLAYDNAMVASDLDNIPHDNLLAMCKASQQAKVELLTAMRDSQYCSGSQQGYVYMVHSPQVNLLTQEEISQPRLYLMCGGWSDKSRAYDQYGVRQQPSGEATFYREISFEEPII